MINLFYLEIKLNFSRGRITVLESILIKKGKKFILEENAGTPAWWNAYNGAKHDRSGNNGDNYKNASLQNVLTALSELYLLEVSMLENASDINNDKTLPMQLESGLFDKKLKY